MKAKKTAAAEGRTKPTTAAERSASAQNPKRQMVTHEGPAAKAASAGMELLRHNQAIAGPRAGFVSHRTRSGHSFGSLQHYCDRWNQADTDEVTSKPSQSLTLPNLRRDEASTGKVVSKIQAVQQALADVKDSTMVSLVPYLIHIPSPRDLGQVSITRLESLTFLSLGRTTSNSPSLVPSNITAKPFRAKAST